MHGHFSFLFTSYNGIEKNVFSSLPLKTKYRRENDPKRKKSLSLKRRLLYFFTRIRMATTSCAAIKSIQGIESYKMKMS